MKDRQRLTLPHVIAVPSALAVLTSLFGMGRGDPRRNSHLKILDDFFGWGLIPGRPDSYRDHLKIVTGCWLLYRFNIVDIV